MRNRARSSTVAADVTALAPERSTAVACRAARTARWALVDVVRGVALVAVVLYHLVWDLGHFGVTEHWARTPSGRMTGHVIAGTFLLLTGVSLALAHRHSVDLRTFGRRLLKLLAAAYAITAVSLVLAPQFMVTFGILQNIALTSVLLLPFLRASRLVAIGAALISAALPAIVSIDSTSRWVTWTGLTPTLSPSLDVQPLLPMFALSLLGLVLTRTLLGNEALRDRVASWQPTGPVSTASQTLGRHTLAIYLAHQPVLFGALSLLVLLELI